MSDIQKIKPAQNNCYFNWQLLLDLEAFLITGMHLFNCTAGSCQEAADELTGSVFLQDVLCFVMI